jgi:peptide/nickel transport system substrate-binding protein
MAMAVDPVFVEANGGVVANQTNSYFETHTLGTGFYKLQLWLQGQSVTLVKNPNYWASALRQSQWNSASQPATIGTVNIYYKPVSSMVADLTSGSAQIALVPSSQYSVLKQIHGLTVSTLPIVFGSGQSVFWLYMDPYAFAPFHNRLVRQAVSLAIDYKGIISTVFNGLATQWIGPVPPGFPYYNESTTGLQPYHYDPVQAAKLLAKAGYVATLPNGTVLNKGGSTFPTVNFLYNLDSPTEAQIGEILKSELQSVGITITLSPLSFKQYSQITFSSSNLNNTQYPFGLAFYSEDYTASQDYVTALTTNGYLASPVVNQTVISWVAAANTALNNTTIIQNFQKITRAMYNDYVEVWFYVPYFITVNQNNVAGMIPNPAGSGAGYFMFYNTVHYTS